MTNHTNTLTISQPSNSVIRSGINKYEAKAGINNYSVIAYGYQQGLGLAEGFYGLIQLIFLKWFRNTNQRLNVLDLGCGVGRFIFDLADEYSQAKFTGLDYAQAMIDRAKEMLLEGAKIDIKRSTQLFTLNGKKLTNVILQQGDARQLPFENDSFDCVNATNLLDRVPDAGIVLGEMMRVLKPGGLLIVSSPLNFDGFDQSIPYTADEILVILSGYGLTISQQLDQVPYQEYKDARSISHWNSFVTWGIKRSSSLIFRQVRDVPVKLQAEAYKTIFEGAPWYEHWSLEQAEETIQDLQGTPNSMGEVLLDQDEVAGFWYGYPLNQKEKFAPIVQKVGDTKASLFYLAEFGIKPAWQGRGIGKQMLRHLADNHFVIVTRTINPRMVSLLRSVYQTVDFLMADLIDPKYADRHWYVCRNPY